MTNTKYKVKTVETRGAGGIVRRKFVPIQKTSFLGFGFWKECAEWDSIEQQKEGEKFLGLDTDTTLTQIRQFIDERSPVKNEYYND